MSATQENIPEAQNDNQAANDASENNQQPQVSTNDEQSRLNRILSMKVPVIVKITEKQMSLERILTLNLGSMIQFEKDAYHNIDLMVNNTTIGYGQPVKIGENFGLRITQICDISDTIKSLGVASK